MLSAIAERYKALGGSKSVVGAPVGSERMCPDNVGAFQHYTAGSIYWHPDNGAFEVHGAIKDHWARLGWERSWLGYPTSDEHDLDPGKRISRFSNGVITWTRETGMLRASDGLNATVHYEQTLPQLDAEFKAFGAARRLITLSSYHAPELRFASTVTSEPGRDQHAIFAADDKTIKKWIATEAANSFHPALVTVSPDAQGRRLYSIVTERYASGEALPQMFLDRTLGGREDQQSLRNAVAWAEANSYIPSSVDLYRKAGGELRAAVVFVPNPDRVAWHPSLVASRAQADAWAKVFGGHGLVPSLTSRTVGDTLIAVWRDDTFGDAWSALPPNTEASFRDHVQHQLEVGRYPVSIAVEDDGSPRFTGVWLHRKRPLPNRWSVTGRRVPNLSALDEAMRVYMTTSGIRAGSIAVSRGPWLVFARAYTNAPSNYPITDPRSTFRMGSCVKVLTGLAVLKLVPELDTKVVELLGLSGVATGFTNVTVRDLLRHESGYYGPDFNEAATRAALSTFAGKPYAETTKKDCAALLATEEQGMKTRRYANNGFVVLGAVIEELTKTDYVSALRSLLFSPAGASRLHRTGVIYDQRPAGEVEHHLNRLAIMDHVTSPTPTLTLRGYGDGNPVHGDACGAMSFAMPDVVRVLSCLTPEFDNSILSPTVSALACPADPATSLMWRSADGATYTHGGGIENAHAFISFTSQSASAIAVAFNRDGANTPAIAMPDFVDIVDDVPSWAWPSADEFGDYGLAVLS